jgi:hypothetical protein
MKRFFIETDVNLEKFSSKIFFSFLTFFESSENTCCFNHHADESDRPKLAVTIVAITAIVITTVVRTKDC